MSAYSMMCRACGKNVLWVPPSPCPECGGEVSPPRAKALLRLVDDELQAACDACGHEDALEFADRWTVGDRRIEDALQTAGCLSVAITDAQEASRPVAALLRARAAVNAAIEWLDGEAARERPE